MIMAPPSSAEISLKQSELDMDINKEGKVKDIYSLIIVVDIVYRYEHIYGLNRYS